MSFIYTYGVIYNITLIYDNKTSIIMCIIICILYIFFSFICVFQIKDLQIALFCLVVWDSKNYCSGDRSRARLGSEEITLGQKKVFDF